jgi:hypothetical protein
MRLKGTSKYRAIKTEVDGIVFDSKKEAARYQELKLMQKAGEIDWIELQPTYPIEINGKKVFEYRADFLYRKMTGERILEDVKGVKTDIYRLKKKCVEAYYGITITEV